jgi:DNA anti-recombination protein RmuC
MPVTAKLSKLFYDRLGDAVANELVDWFNAVDATYRADLRELNELNFARFDAKLDQRVAELHAKLDAKIDRLAAELNGKIDRVAAELNGKIDWVSGELNGKIDRVSGELNGKIDLMSAELKATLERRLGKQTRWLFLTWASLLIPIIGLWIRG